MKQAVTETYTDLHQGILSSSLPFEQITETNLDGIVQQFVELHREIPDPGMRNFENEFCQDTHKMVREQSLFALYVLGKMAPVFDFWTREKSWEVYDPN